MAELIPLQQAAAELNVHRVSLHRYIRQGRLTAYKRGFDHKTYIDRDELRGLLEPKPMQVSSNEEEREAGRAS